MNLKYNNTRPDPIGRTFTKTSGTTSYTTNTLNAYTAIGAASPTHDADGNQTSTGVGQTYLWDAENRLVIIEPVVPTTGDKKQLNVYDAQSRRVRKQVSTYASGSWSLTTDEKFIYDGWNVVAVLDAASSNALLRTYTWGSDLSGSMQGAGGVGGLLSAKDGSSVYHYTYDANGNVSEVLNSSGGIAAHYEYDAFGNTVASSGTYAAANAYRFSTKPLDSVSQLYYYGFRYYNPSTGRWPNRDAIEEDGGDNLHGFIGNDPVNAWDYLGMDFIAVGTRGAIFEGQSMYSHMSIELYTGCAKEGDGYESEQLPQGVAKVEAVELSNVATSYGRYVDATRIVNKRRVGYRQWNTVAISFIVENRADSNRIHVIYDSAHSDVSAKWQSIMQAANDYAYAEHGAIGTPLANWPNSKYQLPPGNNSNTFIREMARVIGRDADAIGGNHPGADRPSPVRSNDPAPTPR